MIFGFFGNFFGGRSKNKSIRESQSTNYRTLEEIVNSGDLGVEGIVAYAVYRTASSVPDTIESPMLDFIQFEKIIATPEYIAEHTIASQTLMIQFEEKYNYISIFGSAVAKDIDSGRNLQSSDVVLKMLHIGHSIARERAQAIGLSFKISIDEFIDLQSRRGKQYLPLLANSLKDNTPVGDRGIFVENSTHPYSIFVEAMADNLRNALGIADDNYLVRNEFELLFLQHINLIETNVAKGIENFNYT